MEHRFIGKVGYSSDWSKCAYCGLTKVVEWTPGWPPSRMFFNAAGDEVHFPEPCNDVKAYRDMIDAEVELDRLEAIAR